MLKHMGDTGLGIALVAGTGIHPDPDGQALRLRKGAAGNLQPAW